MRTSIKQPRLGILAIPAALTCIAAFGLGASAQAQVVDPQIFVCQPGPGQPCTSAPGGTAIGGESNLITTPGAFDIGVAGNFTLQSPLLVGVANINGGTSSISFGGVSSEPLATVGTYGLTTNTVTSFTSGDVFDALGLLQGGGSISFGNLQTEDTLNGFGTPTTYELQVFALPTNLTSGSPITIDTTANPGSFIFAFDCRDGTGTNTSGGVQGQCATNGDVGQTVNTNIGLVDARVPEPASLAIFGAALAGLGLIRRRRKNV